MHVTPQQALRRGMGRTGRGARGEGAAPTIQADCLERTNGRQLVLGQPMVRDCAQVRAEVVRMGGTRGKDEKGLERGSEKLRARTWP